MARFGLPWGDDATREPDPTAFRVVYCAVGRDRALVAEWRDALAAPAEAVALGRHVASRPDPPGWDDVRRGPFRAIKARARARARAHARAARALGPFPRPSPSSLFPRAERARALSL